MFGPKSILSLVLVLILQLGCDMWCIAAHCPPTEEQGTRSSDTADCHHSQPAQENSSHNPSHTDCGHYGYFAADSVQIAKVIHVRHQVEDLPSLPAPVLMFVSERIKDAPTWDSPPLKNSTRVSLRI